MKKLLPLFILSIHFLNPVTSQFGLKDKILKRTQDKLERKVEDKIVEELSEELARMAFQPIENAMDEMLRSSYEEQQGGEVDWEKSGAAYNDFLKSLNANANVPAAYEFNLTVEAEIKDHDKEKHEVTMLFKNSENIIGFKQDQSGDETTIVIDNENNVMIMYSTDDEGNKTAQALPSINTFGKSMMNGMETQDIDNSLKISKINKQKKIAGYLAQGYEFDSDKEKGNAWIAIDFPVDFFEIMANGFSNFMPQTYNETVMETKGMVMESLYENKDDKNIKSSFKVKKVREEETSINNEEWGILQKN